MIHPSMIRRPLDISKILIIASLQNSSSDDMSRSNSKFDVLLNDCCSLIIGADGLDNLVMLMSRKSTRRDQKVHAT
jgi:hypothetical protein